jgi:hypothetical protein
MLKLPEIPNPFKLAFRSYRMTTFGKLLFGSIAAETIYNAISSENKTPQGPKQHGEINSQTNPAQAAWMFYNDFINAVGRTNNVSWWNNLSRCEKQRYIIAVCMERNLGYLVPAIQTHVFPSL